jgi:hypothetical protein
MEQVTIKQINLKISTSQFKDPRDGYDDEVMEGLK